MVFIPFLLAQIKIGDFEDEVKNNIHECVEQREKEKRKIPGGGEGGMSSLCNGGMSLLGNGELPRAVSLLTTSF